MNAQNQIFFLTKLNICKCNGGGDNIGSDFKAWREAFFGVTKRVRVTSTTTQTRVRQKKAPRAKMRRRGGMRCSTSGQRNVPGTGRKVADIPKFAVAPRT